MRVLITGATGLVGKEIVKRCHEKNISVNYLTTRKSKIKETHNYKGFYWNPQNQELDKGCFEDVDAIIHLAGASLSKRWTPAYKKLVLESRTVSTKLLINTLKGEKHNIRQVISASAIGVYPNSLTNYYEESFKGKNKSFLGEVADAWEQAVDEFSALGIIVSKIRIGLVLAKSEGVLPEIVRPVKFGVGAAFGSGKQWQSWIHIEDLSKIFLFVFEKKIGGVYNGVAPNPVSNQELTKITAAVLKRPLIMPNIPKFFMKIILGDMHMLLFESQRVSSKKIEHKGYVFKYNYLESALNNLLK